MIEKVETFPALFLGYSAIWLLIVAYIFSIGKKLKRIEKKHLDK